MRMRVSRERGLARRENWPQYLAGMVAEMGYALVLTAIALVMAVVAKAVF